MRVLNGRVARLARLVASAFSGVVLWSKGLGYRIYNRIWVQ